MHMCIDTHPDMNTFGTNLSATSEGEAVGDGRESECDRGKTTTKK